MFSAFTVHLRTALLEASKIKGGHLNILTHALIETTEEGAFVTSTDYDVTIRHRIEDACVSDMGSVLVPAAALMKFLRALDAKDVVFVSPPDKDKTQFRAGLVNVQIQGIPPEDFPARDLKPTGAPLPFDAAALRKGLADVSYCMSTDESRMHLNSVHFATTDGKPLQLAATDGARGALAAVSQSAWSDRTFEHLVHRAGIAPLMRLLKPSKRVELYEQNGDVLFDIDGGAVLVSIRDIADTYPEMAKVFPKVDDPNPPMLDTLATIKAVKQVAASCAGPGVSMIRLDSEEGEMLWSMVTPEGVEATGRVPCVGITEGRLHNGLNFKYVLEALDICKPGPVAVYGAADAIKQIAFHAADGSSRHVIMPMRRD